nr:SigE family RNA polymerase sigma factor [Kibdelosporangium sp. MJ126-NF4]CEL22003.1 putative RNA polymerase ECF-subfamily sigma factor [Kibdelosporangium sp. MJ126-NF4]CTQ92783.1 putative RNA polymerase ECF-subfamily sigma factor [Kibdelosporangium sp. MJ126-NF4]
MNFEEFVSARLDGLLRYAMALSCDPHLAQDVVQEALLRAQVRWARIGSLDHPLAYVKKMVTNEYLSWRRRKARRDVAMTQMEIVSETADPIARYDLRDEMLARITRLPRKQRAAVVLRYYDGCSDQEIADILGCGVTTVRSHISRAISTLRVAHAEPVA